MRPTRPAPASDDELLIATRLEVLQSVIQSLDAQLMGRTNGPLSEPVSHQEPTMVRPDTYVIHEVQHAAGEAVSIYTNSAVIKATQPVLIETGAQRNQKTWFDDTFSIVDPAEVRWIFLSHDDPDHAGTLPTVMATCPNATLACSRALSERYLHALGIPRERRRWLEDGEMFDAGDRLFAAVRPPVYDSALTLGLLDTKTGVYSCPDGFATPIPGGDSARDNSFAQNVGDLDENFWSHGMTTLTLNGLAPWLGIVDRKRFRQDVQRLTDLEISSVISGHSPVITRTHVADALALLCGLPISACAPGPDRAVLDVFMAIHQTR